MAIFHQSTSLSSETLRVLRECAATGAPTILMNPEIGVVYDARLTNVSGNNIILDVPQEDIEALPEESWCVISFSLEGSAKAVFATSKECLKRGTPQVSRLVLKVSSDLFGVQPRSAYRIPIQKLADLRVRVSIPDGRAWMVDPVNLSLTGILIEFMGEDPGIKIGTQVRLELLLGSNVAVLNGEVKRHQTPQYAISFSDVAYERGLLPPESLKAIVNALDHR